MQTHSELLSLVCVILVLYRFQGSVLTAWPVPREQACLYYHRPKEMSTPFCKLFRFFALLFGFANISQITRYFRLRIIPNIHRSQTFGRS